MENLLEVLTLHGPKVGFFVVVALLGRWGYRWLSTRDERAAEEQLRAAVAAGDHRLAGDIQMRRGLLREAARIYDRGGEHSRAARVFLKLGEEKAAADAHEKAGEHALAAPLFRKLGEPLRAGEQLERSAARADKLLAAECFREAGEHLRAARLLQDLEEYEKAADAFAAVEKLEAYDYSLTMLENAALAVPPEGGRRAQLWRRAGEVALKLGRHEKAARAFDEAGDLPRAAGIYENALKQFDLAAALYAELKDATAVERLTLAAGGQEKVLARREERARTRGDTALVLSLQTELQHKQSPELGKAATAIAGPAVLRPSGDRIQVAPADPGEERFELLSELGRGGMGVVHRARDRRLDRLVALKFLPPDLDPGSPLFRMFQREARAAAAHSHPGIVTIYDIGTLGGREFIAMELVEGTTLDQALESEGPIPALKALDVMERVLEAVEYAHGKGIIHRDLKPANLMRTKSGIKVMDFGLAKAVGSNMTGQQTMIAGTPAYMPPEQLTGRTDFRSDIFALGATFYELITGVLPGLPNRPANLAMGYPSVRDRVPNVPRRLSDLIGRCLDVEPDNRPQDVTSVLREVREVRSTMNAVALELRAFADAATPMPVKEIIIPSAPAKAAKPAAKPAPHKAGGIVEIVEQRGPRGRDDR